MSLIPGWDSITSANWWSSLYFWAGIVALLSLGVFEVFSHRYTERKDELVAQQQDETQRKHDEEIARLHLETAKANKATEELRRQNLELEQAVSPRLLDQTTAAKAIQSLPGTALLAAVQDFEARRFIGYLTLMFQIADWKVATFPNDGRPIFDGIDVEYAFEPGFNPEGNKRAQAAEALVTELKRQNIDARASPRAANILPEVLIVRVGAKPIMHFLERLNPELKEIRERRTQYEMEELRKQRQ